MRKAVAKPYKYHSLVSSGAVRRKKRFKSVIITRSALITAACVVSAVIFLFTAWMLIKNFSTSNGDRILKAGMASAVPFLSVKENEPPKSCFSLPYKILNFVFGVDLKNSTAVLASASPFFSAGGSRAKPAAEKKTPVTINANIKDINSASVNLNIKNESKYLVNTQELVNKELKFDISKSEPCVLIVHTHGSESYTPSEAYKYTQTGNYRTQDTKYNMIRVGDELEKHLKAAGVNTVHDKTINDYPSYNDSYNKTEKVIRENLKNYPSIRFVFDIHRDAVGDDESSVKFTSTVNGEKAAQVMTVCGTDQNLENPLWQNNLSLALKIQQYFEKEYPTFMRPVNLRKERFNMHLTTGSLLFEIGTNSNTLDEALAAARCLGDGLGKVINQFK